MKATLFSTQFWISSTLAAMIWGCQSSNAPTVTSQTAGKRPNVLIIMTDQQTNDALSLMGNPNLRTPHMDALARQGVFFTEAYCTTPVCGPSRSSMLTGRMAHETGVVWNSTHIAANLPTLGHLFGKAGYNTAWAGKWHLPEAYPAKSGLDSVGGFKVIPFQALETSWETGASTDAPIAEAAARYLRGYRENKPFLLAVSLHNPHDICFVPRNPGAYARADQIREPLPPLPANFNPPADEPEFLAEKRKMDHYGDELLLAQPYTEADWRAYLHHYYRFTERVDAEIGKIREALHTSKLADNTLVVFLSDHGDGAASHRWAAKLSLYDEVATVPFSLSWKGHIPEGRIDRSHPVSLLDLLPTLCDYAGVPGAPSGRGLSLRPIIDNPDASFREYVVVQLEDDKLDASRVGRMIRDRRFKYNWFSSGARNEQLFDLWEDAGETRNLAYEPTYQPVKNRLREQLKAWMQETNDRARLP